MRFCITFSLGLILLVSCNSKKNETEQGLNNKWSSLKQFDLDSNICCFTTYISFLSDSRAIEIRNYNFDKNGLLNSIVRSFKLNDSTFIYKTTYDYKFSKSGDLLEIICYESEENDTTKLDMYFSNKFVYADDYVIVKSKQRNNDDNSKFQNIEYKATILSDYKIRFEKGQPNEFEFIMDTYSLEYIATDSLKIEYYK